MKTLKDLTILELTALLKFNTDRQAEFTGLDSHVEMFYRKTSDLIKEAIDERNSEFFPELIYLIS